MTMSLIEKYFDYLPLNQAKNIISLGEGNTPLVQLKSLMSGWGNQYTVYAKFEGLNPTGSFKDRGMTLAISKAKEEGAKAVICASTGNTSASCAAYAAKANMKAIVLIPEGKIAQGKLAQAMMHGAQIVQIEGNFDDAMHLVKEISQEMPLALMNSVNPFRLQGQKTAAYEIIETLNGAPDYHCLPVGNAGNISAYWMGYQEFYENNYSKSCPKMHGYQAKGAAPFLHNKPIEHPETIATAIRIGHPQSWEKAKQAVSQSGGAFRALTDEEILTAQKMLACQEGIFCEPASAISVAGLIKDIQEGIVQPGSTIVCTLTGHGLKDPDIALSQNHQQTISSVKPDFACLYEQLSKSISMV